MHVKDKKKFFVISCEYSGDLLGASIIRGLQKKHGNIEIMGVGANYMQEAYDGFVSIIPMHTFSSYHIVDIITKLYTFIKALNSINKEINTILPDAVITIDSLSFNKHIHKYVKKYHPDIPVLHFVAPKTWLWKSSREKTMNKYIDHLFCLFEYEVAIFNKYINTTFTGHPLAYSAISINNNIKDKNLILLLPGTRKSLIKYLLPVFLQVVIKFNSQYKFLIITKKSLVDFVDKIVKSHNIIVPIICNEQEKIDALQRASFAISNLGTINIELIAYNIVHVGCFVAGIFDIILFNILNKFKYSSVYRFWAVDHKKRMFMHLANKQFNKRIVPELVQEEMTANNIYLHITRLINNDNDCAQYQKKYFKQFIDSMIVSDKHKYIGEFVDNDMLKNKQ